MIPITADEAFDAVAMQIDPLSGESSAVALVDVRTAAEIFWVGAPARVDRIVTTDGEEIIPENGKVRQWHGSNWLLVESASGHAKCPMRIQSSKIASLETSPVSTANIPYEIWDDATATKPVNPNFVADMEALADQGVTTVILMCRSGKRSTKGGEVLPDWLFDTVYEIDQPDGKNGTGGFQGTSYHDHYLGYRGYPGHNTRREEHPSVSWQDAGLPMHIGWNPYE